MKRRRALLPVLVVGFSWLGSACGRSLALRAAEKGDFATLRTEIGERERYARLSLREAAELARTIASRELLAASPETAPVRVRELRACAPELESALAERMRRPDEAGAEAALALLDAERIDASDVRKFVASSDDPWRALGVRSLTRAEDREARVHAALDPSPKVRRAAMHAIRDAKNPADITVAFEAARIDPDPMVRTDAVRVMVQLAGAGGDVANRLRDLYADGDDALREDIGAAWASPAVFPRGGREALRALLASDAGPGALSAAGAVLREPQIHDPEVEAAARAALARAVASGSRRNRLHAIAIAPLVPKPREAASDVAGLVAAVEKASEDEDLDVRVSALERLVGTEASSKDRRDGVRELEAIAGRADDARSGSRARLALANAHDTRVQAWIEQDLASKEPHVRLMAVDALVALNRASRGAPVLVDEDVSVRTRGACALVLAARLGKARSEPR